MTEDHDHTRKKKKLWYLRAGFESKSKSQPVEEPEDDSLPPQEEEPPEEKPVYDVTLSRGVFEKIGEGFAFNKPCKVRIKAELPENCPKKRVTFTLFSEYKEKEEDMNAQAQGFIQNGEAEAKLSLYYNQAYYRDKGKPEDASVEYYFRASHPEVSEPLESERLQMPPSGGWVEVEMLDEADNPVPNAKFTIICPDGSEIEGETDENGIAKVSGVSGKDCEITMKDRDKGSWEPYEEMEEETIEPPPAPEAEPEPEEPPEKETFVEFELRGPMGNPMTEEDYVVETLDGQEINGKTDADGYIKIEGIKGRKCGIKFPNYDISQIEFVLEEESA